MYANFASSPITEGMKNESSAIYTLQGCIDREEQEEGCYRFDFSISPLSSLCVMAADGEVKVIGLYFTRCCCD
ncbi:hypothetical protein JTE90_016927 [Oedothorax gibbosus]|uniref:Uncharacterized protein n=1 Tax=Oedothorax gibbosus TaxID=931172 RepID=A0AAV6UVV5_9ARAC|nr:hypothetical protein JTE90_016927 [Oedothorax gibbosus]